MASYKVENFGMESPTFLSFILINLSVRKWSFLTKKKMARGVPRKGIYLVLSSPLDLKTRLKLQLEHLLCIWIDCSSICSTPSNWWVGPAGSFQSWPESVQMQELLLSVLKGLFCLKIQKLFMLVNTCEPTYWFSHLAWHWKMSKTIPLA